MKQKARMERGFILPMALIVLALLTALAMGLSHMAAIQTGQAVMKKEQFEGYVAVHNATQTALFHLLTGKLGSRAVKSGKAVVPIDGSPTSLAGLSCRIQDTAGLLSLGNYDEKRFERLLRRLLDGKSAEQLAARLGDWLDRDARRRYRGMEVSDYSAAGLNMAPRNGPLRSLDELLELPGMTAELFNGNQAEGKPALRDLLIAGGTFWFNAATAPEILLAPYLQVSDAVVADIVQARQAGDWPRFLELVSSGGISYWEMPPNLASRQFRITCQTTTGLTSRIQLQLKPWTATPYFIQIWQYPDHERI